LQQKDFEKEMKFLRSSDTRERRLPKEERNSQPAWLIGPNVSKSKRNEMKAISEYVSVLDAAA